MENSMKTSDFDYYLPDELIAQTPIKNRSDSRLLVLNKNNGNITHKHFYNIIDYLKKGDVLVLNDTKVLPARLIGSKEETNAVIELLLLKDLGSDTWECLSKPVKRLKIGTIINFNNKLKACVTTIKEEGIIEVRLLYTGILLEILEELGTMPLPPYITKTLKDKDRYQTVYAKEIGSSAAPTAGLHFTKELLQSIKDKGVIITYVTLHVGLGTFRPVKESIITDHVMHSEYYIMNDKTANILNKAKANGKNIVAVGTTSTRVLETIYNKYNMFKSDSGNTDIFIYPGYIFKGIDSLITNFHLPKSTLIMLVSALAGKDNIMKAYNEAVNDKYRFFSFGDAMFIINKKNRTTHWKNLSKLNKNDLVKNDQGIKIYKGTNNILLSAPHAYKHTRNNLKKDNEINTGLITKILKNTTKSHIIYTSEFINDDPNWDNSVYYEVVKDYIKNNNIKYFIDIHGMKDKDYYIELGTNNYNNCSKNDIDNVINIINTNYIKRIAVDELFKSSYKTLCKRIHDDLKIDSLQIEIDDKFRRIKSKQKNFKNLINSLYDIIDYFERK